MWQQEGSGALSPIEPGDAEIRQWRRPHLQAAPLRSTTAISSPSRTRSPMSAPTPVTLYPFALISRHGTPEVSGYYILHEGLIGYLGDKGLQEYGYKKIDDAKQVEFNVTNGWLGITDKYWASALLPDTTAQAEGALLVQPGRQDPHLPDRLSAGSADRSDRRHQLDQCAAVRRRQGSQRRRHQLPAGRPRRLQQAARPQPFRSA